MNRPRRATVGCLRLRLVSNRLGVARLGIAPGKCRTAVERNLVRRRVRELVREHQEELVGFDLSVGVGVEAATIAFTQLRADLEKALRVVLPVVRKTVGREL